MTEPLVDARPRDAIAIIPVTEAALAQWLPKRPTRERAWLEAAAFRAKPGQICLVPDARGGLAAVVTGVDPSPGPWRLAHLPGALPRGTYWLDADWPADAAASAALGWALACYRFGRYRKTEAVEARLVVPGGCDGERLRQEARAVGLVRDLINVPAADMMPENLGDAAIALAAAHGATVRQVVGDALLTHGYPAIHAVGRASAHPPRLIELTWGEPDAPLLGLVGKGVCFDSGGLDIKPPSGMRLMKKDMGGAAHALGVASLVMAAGLPVRLRLLIAAVENAISSNAYRPGDIIRTRKGLTVEVDNTDAEGRIVMSDALADLSDGKPDLVVDFSTLTGAARVALGPELPAMFCNDDAVADALLAAARDVHDPMWRMPLHAPYREMLESRFADLVNSASSPFAGAVTAALFLEHFVTGGTPWVHFDIMAWNPRAKPGRPEGGEAMGVRAVAELARRRYPPRAGSGATVRRRGRSRPRR
ncbi:MAG: leucyl aminopeptidase family protein [Ectothiorhodospiraceae bacterium]|nr:leucyl aminopeptidase family protein [Chromatiales bacterium]MCP5156863.1 leucyl aminopeptidase family protein [Ectothiorhodospiraceae bacterium]